jgi:hypothetical protein
MSPNRKESARTAFRRVALLSPSGGLRSDDICDGRWCSRSAMEAARGTLFHRRRWHHRRRCRFTVDAEVQPAPAAVIAIAGQEDERFLVAEQQTQKMGHDRLPNEASHCRGQPGSGECPSRRQQSWFCDRAPARTRRRETRAALRHAAAASTVSTDGRVMLDATTSSRRSSSDAASRSTRAVSRSSESPGHRCPRRHRAGQP